MASNNVKRRKRRDGSPVGYAQGMTRFFLALVLTASATAQTVGEPLPAWTEGGMDIHFINTGRGDAALLVLPDGTSLQIDAGDGGWGAPPRGVVRKPNDSRSAGEWLGRYARRVLPHSDDLKIDYVLLTHLHGDHMSGFRDLWSSIDLGVILDRGYPEYDYPGPQAGEGAKDYIEFVRQGARTGSFQAERFKPGLADQIRLLRRPEAYPNFQVRNIAANGEVWTGVGTATRKHFPADLSRLPSDEQPSENQTSAAIRVSYGAFDFYSGGDMPGVIQPGLPAWMDVETPVAKAVGPVEVAAANHHGNRDSTNAFFVSTLRPRLWILQVWSSDHPGMDVLARMLSTRLYTDDRDVLATNMPTANYDVIGPLLERLLSDQGHIVIRVAPGGGQYRAIVLEDGDESMRVKAIHGPYESR